MRTATDNVKRDTCRPREGHAPVLVDKASPAAVTEAGHYPLAVVEGAHLPRELAHRVRLGSLPAVLPAVAAEELGQQ
jgi:hypothetical protein